MATRKRQRAGKGTAARRRVQRRRAEGRRPAPRTAAAATATTGGQRERRREQEVPRLLRSVGRAAVEAPATPVSTPLAVAVAALIEDTLRLVRTLVTAPFRLADALRKIVVA